MDDYGKTSLRDFWQIMTTPYLDLAVWRPDILVPGREDALSRRYLCRPAPRLALLCLRPPRLGTFPAIFLSTLLHKLFPLHLESNIFLMILRDLQFASTQFLTNMRVKWYNRYSQEVKPFNPRYAHCWRFFLSYKWIRSILLPVKHSTREHTESKY